MQINLKNMKKIEILHVDDSILDRILIKDTLMQERDTFNITSAATREEFEYILKEKFFDVILSDFNILGFDGLQVLDFVKKVCPEIPVIIVTGTGSEEIAIQAIKLGAADYVIKSVKHIKGLALSIHSVLEHVKTQKELKRAQYSIRESEALFRAAFENAASGVCLISKDGKFLKVNNTICNILGYTEKELLDFNIFDISYPEDYDSLKLSYKELTESKQQRLTFEKRFINKNNNIIWALISTGYVEPENKEGCFVTYLHDITKNKDHETQLLTALKKAEESDRLKTAFLNNISHEIRTPLNAIMGFSYLLTEPDTKSEDIKKFTKIITDSGEQLLAVITDIINIATIEAGQEAINAEHVNINETCNLIFCQFSDKAKKQNSKLKVICPVNAKDMTLHTDKTKLMRILSNLIDNSIKFTINGEINFGYTIDKKFVKFFVKDNGPGIPKESFDEIFKKFTRIDSNNEELFSGAGLGLSITKAYVKLLGGEIWLKSTPAKETIFYFSVPIKSEIGQIPDYDEIRLNKYFNDKDFKILIAEDEETNYLLLKNMLKITDNKLFRAKNGFEALQFCQNNMDTDLILMDIRMPVMDGFEATRKIKDMLPNITIIGQSAYVVNEEIDYAFECGCDEFITKPVKKSELLSKIKDLKS